MSFIKIFIYRTKNGRVPFSKWKDSLDEKTRAIVRTRLDRVRLGNFGDSKRIKDGNGIWELRISYGPGYRIYFGKMKTTLVILLVGGNKGSQKRDIEKAKQYWLETEESFHE
ncbi:type II toxin-antitoxin system RelE/ParE family toxin [Candidatus Dependentiae bacterium]|nr:MAG: type II toxin-antitoxin system RelE/ParE family toxin [Candidatus Dependentiae bacterium]